MNVPAEILESEPRLNRASRIALASICVLAGLTMAGAQMIPLQPNGPGVEAGQQSSVPSFDWKSPARLHQGSLRGSSGTLSVDPQGIQFLPNTGSGSGVLTHYPNTGHSEQWAFVDIKSLDLRPNRMVLTGYDNRRWHMPKQRQFQFKFEKTMTPAIAALLEGEINKPIQNRLPDPNAQTIAVVAVHRSRHLGGSNGMLRIRRQGIDYVTAAAGQSRSWRWLDIKTLSHPDPYHLFVFGYEDSYAFDLKESITRELFNHLSDEIWTHNDSDTTDESAGPPAMPTSPAMTGRPR